MLAGDRRRAHLVLLGDAGGAVLDEARLGRGAAHVEGHQVPAPQPAAERPRGDHPRGRAGLDHEDRLGRRRPEGVDAAAALHQQQGGLQPRFAQARLDALQVAGHGGPDAGVDHRGAGPEVLAEVGGHLAGEGDGLGAEALPQDLAGALLVGGIGVGVEEADGDRFHALGLELRGRLAEGGLVEGADHLAGRVEALRHPEAAVARHQGRRLLEVDIVEGGPDLALDLQQVAEALGGDEPGGREAALDDGVGGHRRPVDDVAHLLGRDPRLVEDAGGDAQEALGGVGGRGGELADVDPAAGLVHEGGVGEGAADVDAEAEAPRHGRRRPFGLGRDHAPAYPCPLSRRVSSSSTLQASVSTATR